MAKKDFDAQVYRASRLLKPYALRFTKNMDDANDLVQDTLVKALTYQEKFSEGTNLSAWLFTIMRNTFITNCQRSIKKKHLTTSIDTLLYINSEGYRTYNLAQSSFVHKDVTRALTYLSEPLKQCFMMHYEGYKYEEIAEEMEVPIGTVKNRIHIARKELQYYLKMYNNNNSR